MHLAVAVMMLHWMIIPDVDVVTGSHHVDELVVGAPR